MEKRIIDKIEETERYLQELSEIVPNSFEEYKTDFMTKAACERYIERIIQAVTDLAILTAKELNFKSPEEEDTQVFDILQENKIISLELSDKMHHAKGMRNILAHKYGDINDEIVFDSLTDELEKDINEFIKSIKLSLT